MRHFSENRDKKDFFTTPNAALRTGGVRCTTPPMVHTVLRHGATGSDSASVEAFTKAYRFMLLGRILDEKLASLYRMGKIHGGVFLGRGQEALSVALGAGLRKRDVFAPLMRDIDGRLSWSAERSRGGEAPSRAGSRQEPICLLDAHRSAVRLRIADPES